MYQTQQALIAHLQNANPVPDPAAAQIKEYAGEVQRGLRQSVDMPCILILHIDGNPLAWVPKINFEILFASRNETLQRNKAKSEALKFAQAYAEFLRDNTQFEDSETYYSLTGPGDQTLEDVNIETILNDKTYCLMSLPVTVVVNRT